MDRKINDTRHSQRSPLCVGVNPGAAGRVGALSPVAQRSEQSGSQVSGAHGSLEKSFSCRASPPGSSEAVPEHPQKYFQSAVNQAAEGDSGTETQDVDRLGSERGLGDAALSFVAGSQRGCGGRHGAERLALRTLARLAPSPSPLCSPRPQSSVGVGQVRDAGLSLNARFIDLLQSREWPVGSASTGSVA